MFEALGPDFLAAFDPISFRWRDGNVAIRKKWLQKMADISLPAFRKFVEGRHPTVKPRGFLSVDTREVLSKDAVLDRLAEEFNLWMALQATRTTLHILNGYVYHSCIHCGRENTYNMFHALGDERLHRIFYYDIENEDSRVELYTNHEIAVNFLPLVGLCQNCNQPCRRCNAKIPAQYNHKRMTRWFQTRTCPACMGALPTMFEFPKITRGEWRKLSERRK